MPPAFIVQAVDDPVDVDDFLVYYLALKKAAASVEMGITSTPTRRARPGG